MGKIFNRLQTASVGVNCASVGNGWRNKKLWARAGVLRVTRRLITLTNVRRAATVSRGSRRKLIMLNYTLGDMTIVFQFVIDSIGVVGIANEPFNELEE